MAALEFKLEGRRADQLCVHESNWRPSWTVEGVVPPLLPVAGLVYLGSVLWRPVPGHSVLWDDWFANAVYWAAAGVCLAGVLRRSSFRGGGFALMVGLVAYAIGNTVWTVWVAPLATPPYPSAADYLWLMFYPFAVTAIVLMSRGRTGGSPLHWVDGAVAALSIAAVGFQVALAPIAHDVTGHFAAVVVNMAYPVGDLTLIMLLVAVSLASRHRPGPAWWLLGIALLLWSVADTTYVFQVATDTYRVGTVVDAGWLVPATMIALVPWLPVQNLRAASATANPPRRIATMVVPVALMAVCLVLLTWRAMDEAAAFAVAAAMALAVGGVRLVMTVREVEQLWLVRSEARTDALTGLGNRRALVEVLHARLGQEQPLSLLLMDLDGFKDVNDTLGHEAGDHVLQVIGTRMADCVRGDDVTFRLGGDEFAVLVVNSADRDCDRLIERLTTAIGTPIAVGDVTVSVGVSVGVVVCPDQATQGAEALRLADIAMYHAKRRGLGSAHYEPSLDEANQRRLTMAVQLRQALQAGQFHLDYQPVVDVVSGHTQRVEALLRWDHPELGLLLPAAFLDVVTDAGQHEALTRFVVTRALEQHHAWAATGVQLPVSVNVGRTDLSVTCIADLVEEALDSCPTGPGQLMLEFTEASLSRDPDHAVLPLTRLRERGVAIALDDFGATFAGLALLRDLPLSEVKIDSTFVSSCSSDPIARTVVEQTLKLANTLGLRAVAEGVDAAAVRQELTSLGCQTAQGYLWAPALPGDQIAAWIAAPSGTPTATAAPLPSPRTPIGEHGADRLSQPPRGPSRVVDHQ